ncbi:MAG: hypothetical protein WA399_15560 [Acidobacteriaceae bacterium]|jgi:hypothetical protein
MRIQIATLSYIANVLAFLVALPITAATWYQALRARQELRRSREVVVDSANCLEFITADGACVNLVPLDTLRTLPHPGDIVFLPGDGVNTDTVPTGAWRVDRVEHIYTRVHRKNARPQEARLTQAIAHVTSLHASSADETTQLDLVSS